MRRPLILGVWTACITALLLLVAPRPAAAGCGCTKPAPAPAALRPAAAWSGAEITIFDDSLVGNGMYSIRFDAASGAVRFEKARAIVRRDLADGVMKPQIVVPVPQLPLGPAGVSVHEMDHGPAIVAAPDDMFTVAPQPVGIPTGVGRYRFENYRAAVSRAGVVHLSLDFGDIQHARVFDARAIGLPLRFESEDLAFWNIQGFLMQLLGQNMPGLFAIDASNGADSDVLHYSRHEFNTYFLQHGERQSHAVDPSDPNWHLDGTRHIDHDHQILEMAATLPNGATLPPGATPAFTLEINNATLFQHGVVGRDSVRVADQAVVRSNGVLGNQGHVLSNGAVVVENFSVVSGDATGSSFSIDLDSFVLGLLHDADPPVEFLPVDEPSGLVDLGDFVVDESTSLGVGSYVASKLEVVAGATLRIENEDGPVTVYVTGDLRVHNGAEVVTDDPNPEKVAIYMVGAGSAEFTNDSDFHGVVYGPDAEVKVDNGGTFAGAFVGATMEVKNGAEVVYDESLHTNWCSPNPLPLELPEDLVLVPGEMLSLPNNLVGMLTGHHLRIGRGASAPLLPLPVVDGVGILVPPNLDPGSEVEITLVDALGCRSMRTRMVPVAEPPPPACGLLGVELAILGPLALRLQATRRRRQRPVPA